ncbi:unnamed protein product [Amoebophrya sp. A120]|nr:unnamed protein product [Amoebophrya sp. A120]|eukprot:GSA120T00002703001.1
MLFIPRGRGWQQPEQNDQVDPQRRRYSGVISFLLMMMFLSLLFNRDKRGPDGRNGSSNDREGWARNPPPEEMKNLVYPWDAAGLPAEARLLYVGPASTTEPLIAEHDRVLAPQNARRLVCSPAVAKKDASSKSAGANSGKDNKEERESNTRPSEPGCGESSKTCRQRMLQANDKWACETLVPKWGRNLLVTAITPPKTVPEESKGDAKKSAPNKPTILLNSTSAPDTTGQAAQRDFEFLLGTFSASRPKLQEMNKKLMQSSSKARTEKITRRLPTSSAGGTSTPIAIPNTNKTTIVWSPRLKMLLKTSHVLVEPPGNAVSADEDDYVADYEPKLLPVRVDGGAASEAADSAPIFGDFFRKRHDSTSTSGEDATGSSSSKVQPGHDDAELTLKVNKRSYFTDGTLLGTVLSTIFSPDVRGAALVGAKWLDVGASLLQQQLRLGGSSEAGADDSEDTSSKSTSVVQEVVRKSEDGADTTLPEFRALDQQTRSPRNTDLVRPPTGNEISIAREDAVVPGPQLGAGRSMLEKTEELRPKESFLCFVDLAKKRLRGQISQSVVGTLVHAFFDADTRKLVLVFRNADRIEVLTIDAEKMNRATGKAFTSKITRSRSLLPVALTAKTDRKNDDDANAIAALDEEPSRQVADDQSQESHMSSSPTAAVASGRKLAQPEDENSPVRRFFFRSTQSLYLVQAPVTSGYVVFVSGQRVAMVLSLRENKLIEERYLPWSFLSQDLARVRRRIPDRYVQSSVATEEVLKPCPKCCGME